MVWEIKIEKEFLESSVVVKFKDIFGLKFYKFDFLIFYDYFSSWDIKKGCLRFANDL